MKLSRCIGQVFAPSLTLLAFALPAEAEVLVVDNNDPGVGQFKNIKPAVNAAADGDTIVVMGGGGPYKRFEIIGKSLTVVPGDPAVKIMIGENQITDGSQPSATIRGLAEHQEVVLRGIAVNFGVLIEDCAGSVLIDQMRVDGSDDGDGICTIGGVHGATVRNSHKVTFTRCSLTGENSVPGFFDTANADGLYAESATVHLLNCTVTGGWGSNGHNSVPQEGGAGLRLLSSTVHMDGCEVLGGAGGTSWAGDIVCDGSHAIGGPGVAFEAGSATLRMTSSTVEGGEADLDVLCPGVLGPKGLDYAGLGEVIELRGAEHELAVNSPVDAGERLIFRLQGVPGELAVVLVSLDHDPMLLPAGVLVGDLASQVRIPVGGLAADGTASTVLIAPSLGALGSVTLFAQAAFVDPTPQTWLGGAAAVVLLDQ